MMLFFYYLLQWTWGLPQNLLGLVVWLICKGETQPRFHGAAIKRWRRSSGSAGIGMFLFLQEDADRELLLHEYGHSLQSIILGPLFLPVVGLPSLLWAQLPVARRWRKRHQKSYYWLYCESWANRLGSFAAKEEALPCSKTETKL